MNQRRLAWTIWGLSIVFSAGSVVVDASSSSVDIGEYVFVMFAVLLYSTVGALITSRQSGNRVGWLFAWVGLSASLGLLADAYATMAQQRDLPFLAATVVTCRRRVSAQPWPRSWLWSATGIWRHGKAVSCWWSAGWLCLTTSR